MKRIRLILLLLLLITITGCTKGKSSYKTLTCDYDFNEAVSGTAKTSLKITFNQDRKTFELVKGTIFFEVSFEQGLSNEEMNDLKKSLNEQFCEEGFFGEGTNKSCKVSSQTKSASVTIEVDTEKLVSENEDIDSGKETLDDLKAAIEENFESEVKCSIN
jgi:hypothetical protein